MSLLGWSHGPVGDEVKVAQEVQEAHRTGHRSTPAARLSHPSGTHCPFPTARQSWSAPRGSPVGPGVTQRHHLGRLLGSQARTGVPLPAGVGGRAIIPVPHGPDTWKSKVRAGNGHVEQGQGHHVRKEGASPTARIHSPVLMPLRAVPEGNRRMRRKQKTKPTLFLYKVSYLIWS